MSRFRLRANYTIKGKLFSKDGRLLSVLYDSGFTRLKQVRQALVDKCQGSPLPSGGIMFSVYVEENDTFWNNF